MFLIHSEGDKTFFTDDIDDKDAHKRTIIDSCIRSNATICANAFYTFSPSY